MSMATFEKDCSVVFINGFGMLRLARILLAGENQQTRTILTRVSVINFTSFLFSCVKFSWIQLSLKIYYC